MLARRPGSAINPVGSPVAPLRALVAQAATRQRLHKLGQISGVARIPRRTRTPERTLPPLLPRLPALIVFSPNSSRCQLTAHRLTTAPSSQLSRRRRNSPRPPSPQLRPRRNCSDPPLPMVTIRPLKENPPTVDLVLGYKKSNKSPILKLLLSRLDELVARVSKREKVRPAVPWSILGGCLGTTWKSMSIRCGVMTGTS